jgi:hypothetical protein
MKTIKKMLSDTLCSPSGKFSRKSLTMFASFMTGIALTVAKVGTTMPILAQFHMEVPEELILYFLAMASGHTVMTVWDKKKQKPDETA